MDSSPTACNARLAARNRRALPQPHLQGFDLLRARRRTNDLRRKHFSNLDYKTRSPPTTAPPQQDVESSDPRSCGRDGSESPGSYRTCAEWAEAFGVL